MSWNAWGRLGSAMLLVGCSGRLVVDADAPFTGGGGSGGAQVMPATPLQGILGHSCVPSETVTEAMGTVGQADVVRAAHCNAGLTCGSDGLCAAIQGCPQGSGNCVVYRAEPSGVGGGDAGASQDPHYAADNITRIAFPESGVQALAALDSRVYWIEYGTRDSLGNYANDGSLKVFDGQVTTTLSSRFPGPMALALTSSHAYVFVDGGTPLGTAIKNQLWRVPFAGGEPELVQDGTQVSFVGVGDRAFWSWAGTIYSVTADAGAAPTIFQTDASVTMLAADTTNIYYDGNGGVESAPIVGGPAVSLGFPFGEFMLRGDSIYGFDEVGSSSYSGPHELVLDQAPKAGGMIQRVRALGVAEELLSVQTIGERYFWDQYGGDHYNELAVKTASFESPDPVVRVLDTPVQESFIYPQIPWAVTPTALYWTDGSSIYSRSLADLP